MHKPTTAVPSHAKLALVQVLQKEQLGKAIEARRKELGLTQKALAELAHVKEGQTVSRWERGKNEPEDLPAVAKALQWTVAEMMRGIEPIRQKDRRGMDPRGETQLDRIERMVYALTRHFDLDERSIADIANDAANAVDPPPGENDAPPESAPARRRRKAA